MPRRSRKNLDWRGPEVKRAVLKASQRAVDDTMSRAVKDAKQNVPVVTATLQGSIRIQPSEIKGEDVDGLWGSFEVNYALAVETGNRALVPSGGDNQREMTPNIGRGIRTGNTGFLRNAADKEYPKLKARIQAELAKLI